MKNIFSIKPVIALLAVGSLAACNNSSSNGAGVAANLNAESASIIGGVPVEKNDFPNKTTVAILTFIQAPVKAPAGSPDAGKFQLGISTCTGTLIAKNVVLTAGHCVYKAKPNEKTRTVIVFSNDLNGLIGEKKKDGPQLPVPEYRFVTKAIPHPLYGKSATEQATTEANDVALMQFDGEMPAGYQLATVLTDESVLKAGATVTLAGFGYTDGAGKKSDGLLRKVDVQVLEAFNATEVAVDQSLGKGACHGDSGGPAFINVGGVEYVWGVTSRGAGKNGVDDCSLYGIYTKIYAQKLFINRGLQYLNSLNTAK